ncbi:MAG: cytidylate kinase [Dehalococcoidia bacterium]|nr:cytidylate kinase [Dehalococcoidia bacterium]
MTKKNVIAIDGPVAAGKSIIGQYVATRLGFRYFDTGVIYRSVAWIVHRQNIDESDKLQIELVAAQMSLDLDTSNTNAVIVNGVIVSDELKTQEVTRLSSIVAALPGVRNSMTSLQRNIIDREDVVMVGRDIGSIIAPDAVLKIYLTASVESRARRRFGDLSDQGLDISFSQVLQETISRDERDSSRTDSPLVIPHDAISIDNSEMTIEETVDVILEHYRI